MSFRLHREEVNATPGMRHGTGGMPSSLKLSLSGQTLLSIMPTMTTSLLPLNFGSLTCGPDVNKPKSVVVCQGSLYVIRVGSNEARLSLECTEL
jgi:hypothetical protein